jgi:hypothetical protein
MGEEGVSPLFNKINWVCVLHFLDGKTMWLFVEAAFGKNEGRELLGLVNEVHCSYSDFQFEWTQYLIEAQLWNIYMANSRNLRREIAALKRMLGHVDQDVTVTLNIEGGIQEDLNNDSVHFTESEISNIVDITVKCSEAEYPPDCSTMAQIPLFLTRVRSISLVDCIGLSNMHALELLSNGVGTIEQLRIQGSPFLTTIESPSAEELSHVGLSIRTLEIKDCYRFRGAEWANLGLTGIQYCHFDSTSVRSSSLEHLVASNASLETLTATNCETSPKIFIVNSPSLRGLELSNTSRAPFRWRQEYLPKIEYIVIT